MTVFIFAVLSTECHLWFSQEEKKAPATQEALCLMFAEASIDVCLGGWLREDKGRLVERQLKRQRAVAASTEEKKQRNRDKLLGKGFKLAVWPQNWIRRQRRDLHQHE